MSDDEDTDDGTKPIKTYTHVGGTKRSLQYYALRQGYKWEMTEKSRCWATVMKEAWGSDLDAITLLGIEPKPVVRTWRRFEEMRELVDLGRRKTDADTRFKQLKTEAADESKLREMAVREVREEARKKAKEHIADAEERAKKHAKAQVAHGALYALRYVEYKETLDAAFVAEWSKELIETLEGVEATKTVLKQHVAKAEEKLVEGAGPDLGYGNAFAKRTATPRFEVSLRAWRKELLLLMSLHERIKAAQKTISDRDLATESKLTQLTQGAGGVSGAPGAP